MTRILAGDVGATQTTLALFEGEALSQLRCKEQLVFENSAFSGLVAMVGEFMHGARVDAAAFAIQGFVSGGNVAEGEAPWAIESAPLRSVLGTNACSLLTQAQAALYGVQHDPREVTWLQQGSLESSAPCALVHVGERYGRAFALPAHGPLATDAGHVGFAPRNAIERRLLNQLSEHIEHVSLTDVLGERGLSSLYRLLVAEGLAPPTAQAEIERAPNPNAEIARLGCRDLDRACAASVAFFADLLGSELSNVALSYLPRGGLYVAGSAVQRLRPVFEQGPLLDAFLDRDTLGDRLESIPLALVDDAALALRGATQAAKLLCER